MQTMVRIFSLFFPQQLVSHSIGCEWTISSALVSCLVDLFHVWWTCFMFGGLPRLFIQSHMVVLNESDNQPIFGNWMKSFRLSRMHFSLTFKDAFFSVKLETETPYKKFYMWIPNWLMGDGLPSWTGGKSTATDSRWWWDGERYLM